MFDAVGYSTAQWRTTAARVRKREGQQVEAGPNTSPINVQREQT